MNRIAFFSLLLGLSLVIPARGVTISTDTIIGPDNSYPNEMIIVNNGDGDATTVQVIEGGVVRGFYARETSHVIIDGGTNTYISTLLGEAKLTMRSGAFGCFDSACGVITPLGILVAFEQSEIHFYGGDFGGKFGPKGIFLFDNSVAHIYGRELSVEGNGTVFDVSGIYGDGTPFLLGFDTNLGISQLILHEIPEPGSLVIATLIGSLLILSRHC